MDAILTVWSSLNWYHNTQLGRMLVLQVCLVVKILNILVLKIWEVYLHAQMYIFELFNTQEPCKKMKAKIKLQENIIKEFF